MRHVRIKGDDGSSVEQDMTGQELEAWFKDNSKDGVVMKDITLFTEADFKAVDGDSVEWIMSDMSLDRDMERVDPDGADFKNYKKNPVVLWAHDYSRPAIGKIEGVKVKDGNVIGKVVFDNKDNDPFADMIGRKVKNRIISAGSIGFKPNNIEFVEDSKDPTRLVHRKWELMEFSICNVPSNQNALAQRSVGADELDYKLQIEELKARIKALEAAKETKTYITDLFKDRDEISAVAEKDKKDDIESFLETHETSEPASELSQLIGG